MFSFWVLQFEYIVIIYSNKNDFYIYFSIPRQDIYRKHEINETKTNRDTVSLLQATAMTGLDIYGYDTSLPDSDDEPFSDIDWPQTEYIKKYVMVEKFIINGEISQVLGAKLVSTNLFTKNSNTI